MIDFIKSNNGDFELNLDEENNYSEVVEKYKIADLINTVKSTPQAERIRLGGYLGSGFDKDVFKHGDLAIKFLKSDGSNRSVAEQASPLITGQGVPKLEQLLAVNENDKIMITTIMSGVSIPNMTNRDIFNVSKNQLIDLNSTLIQMRTLGLHPHNVGGILYDKNEGFSFVDYEFIDQDGNRGDINNLESFLNYILADHNKFDAMFAMSDMLGCKQDLRTTGLRALARMVFIKRFKRLTRSAK